MDLKTKSQLDRDMIHLVLKAGELLQQRRHLESARADSLADECLISQVRQRESYQVMRFASYLSFETHQAVMVRRIEKGNMKYNRC